MPFKSDRQRKWCFASGTCKGNHPHDWNEKTALKIAEAQQERLQKRIEEGDTPFPMYYYPMEALGFKGYREHIDSIIREAAERRCGSDKACIDDFFKEFDDMVVEMQEDIVDNAKIFVNIDREDFFKMLKDRRFKTQHEVYDSNGNLNPMLREKHEEWAFAFDPKTPKKYRPVYGWWATHSGMAKEIKDAVDSQYGRITVELKPKVKRRATFTSDDSLNNVTARTMVWGAGNMGRYNVPDSTAADIASYLEGSTPRMYPPNSSSFWTGVYTEAQVHGGVGLNDVAKIYIPKGETKGERFVYDTAAQAARKKGLKVIRIKNISDFKPEFDYYEDSNWFDYDDD